MAKREIMNAELIKNGNGNTEHVVPIARMEELIRQHAVQRVMTPHVQALTVQKPRDLDKVRQRVVNEATLAGDLAFYNWSQAGKNIMGLSGLFAVDMMRAFGNCVLVPEAPYRDDDAWMFVLHFVDTETGASIPHIERWVPEPAPGKFAQDQAKSDRWYRMQFQKGLTIAKRNCILKGGLPHWLQVLALQAAQRASDDNITGEGIQASYEKARRAFAVFGVTPERIKARIGLEDTLVGTKEIQFLRTVHTELQGLREEVGMEASEERAREIFPEISEPITAEFVTDEPEPTEKTKRKAPKPKTDTQDDAQEAARVELDSLEL